MRRALAIAALLVLAFPATVGAAAKTYTVKTGDNFFSPTKKTIRINDILKWTWVGEDGKAGETLNEHTIAERDGKLPKLRSSTKTSGTYKFRFKKAGKYVVICADHPDDMKIRVTVKK